MSHPSIFTKGMLGIILSAIIIGAIIPTAVLFLVAFPTETHTMNAIESQPELLRFISYEQLVIFLKKSYENPYYRDGVFLENSAPASGTDYGSSQEYSKTNIQVEGVDEADTVKCDGEYIYLVTTNSILIVKAYPPEEAEIETRIDLNGTVRGIFVNGDRLVVFEEEYQYYTEERLYLGGYRVSTKVYDITDKEEPTLTRNVTVDGYYFNSRMIGDYVYVLINTPAYLQDDEVELPSIQCDGQTEKIEASTIYYSNVTDYYYTFTNILAINVKNDTEEFTQQTLLIGATGCIYVSLNNIYIAIPNYRYITMSAPTNIMGTEITEIHRIHIENGTITYEKSGEVPGYILNQFSMDEYNGYFRIATTTSHVSGDFEQATSTNHVYVLNLNLTIVGKLENLASGERIYSARFIGERCYMVTFKKIDPLFVISLEDPANPTILGKLKIPGYSDYLHPYDENHLIGIGKNTIEAEEGDWAWYQGVKISLFDVSDVENPKEVANFTIGDRGTDSPVLWDHKALLFDKERNLLAIPVLVAEIDEEMYPEGVPPYAYGDYVWQGLYVFNITENDITLRGRITHMENVTDFLKSDYWFYSEYSVGRALYIDNVLYTISDKKIKMNDLATLEEINELELPTVYTQEYPGIVEPTPTEPKRP